MVMPGIIYNPRQSEWKLTKKTLDETVNNSNVLQNDNELFFPVAANEIWAVILVVKGTSPTVNPGFSMDITVPVGATLTGLIIRISGGGVNVANIVAGSGWGCDTSSDEYIRCVLQSIYKGGANAGNVQFQWAQTAAVAEDTKVLASSYFLRRRIL